MIKKPTTIDKVTACSRKVEDPQLFPSAVFKGERLFFCTPACLCAFESDSEGFMAGEIEHPLDEE